MGTRRAQVFIVAAACLIGLAGCSSSSKLNGLWATDSNKTPNAPAIAAAASNGMIAKRAGAADDDLSLGKKYFRDGEFALAETSFRSAADKHPGDATAWIGLATAEDRLHRFDLADQAYERAIRLIGPTAEILNDQGYSYMLRGDYARARKTLEEAEVADPADPYVQANMRKLEERYFAGKAAQR